MHSPTLITFGAMLIALVSCVLFAVWRFKAMLKKSPLLLQPG